MSKTNGLKCAFAALFLTLFSIPAFSANGVSLDVLRDDPYALDGSTVSAAEQNRAKNRDGLAEDEEEDAGTERPRVFTNADNWPLYPWTVYDVEADQSQVVTGNERVTLSPDAVQDAANDSSKNDKKEGDAGRTHDAAEVIGGCQLIPQLS